MNACLVSAIPHATVPSPPSSKSAPSTWSEKVLHGPNVGELGADVWISQSEKRHDPVENRHYEQPAKQPARWDSECNE